jgi:hypothetical protein
MLIDRYLPKYDVTYICEASVDALPEDVYAAVRETNLRDPVVDALFALRELPLRIARRLRGEAPPPPALAITFGDIAQVGPGWVLLDEEPGVEFVIGSVGRFWRRDYGGRKVTAEDFIPFREPGYAKLALGLAVRRAGTGAILRYEARTATTDESARRKFRRYWRLIAPGVGLVMRRVLRRMKAEAERRAAVPA